VSFTVFWSLFMATFACIGLVMGRLGHSAFAWGVLGLLLGPIALLLALVVARDEPCPARLVGGRIGKRRGEHRLRPVGRVEHIAGGHVGPA
jgi:hypothetical protein